MRVKEFSIIRYGPLLNTDRISLSNFNLFFGKQEVGKTLTIDALVKMLFKRERKVFDKIDRVEEEPGGYLILQKGDKEVKFPEKGDLSRITDLNAHEFRNIFIIRDSDLSILQESSFYGNITDRLTGLRTKEISDIKKKLQELGKLTRPDSSGSISDAGPEKIKSRVESTKVLIENIKKLHEEIKEEKFDELDQNSQKITEEIDEIQQELNRFNDAQNREKYEKGIMALETLKSDLKEIDAFKSYSEEDKQSWRDYERDIKTFKEDKEKLISELNKKENQIEKKGEELYGKEREFRILKERKKKLDEEIKPDVKNYEKKSEELILQETKNKFFTSITIISAILLGISLLGIILRPSLMFYVLAILFSISAVISGVFKFQFIRGKAWLAGAFERIKLVTSKFELDAESIERILSNIWKFDEEYPKKESEVRDIEKEVSLLKEEIRGLKEERIPGVEKKIEDAESKIEEIRRKSGVETLQEYDKKLELKQKHEKSKMEQKSILESHFRSKKETLEEKIEYWNGEIKDLEEYKDKAKEIEYNKKTVSELADRKESLEEEKQRIKEKLYNFHEKLREIERKANEILRLEGDYLYCKTSVDLDAIKERLQEFISENENNKENILEVMKIFEQIEAEEEEKISELFGEDSSVSEYFKEITGGLYKEVMLNQETKKIEVRRKNEVILGAEKLSGGAYDQLYLSIRLSLGEKLLKGEKGFFIMDDPFIKADPDRLQRQIEMLKKISELEWQVIYFSAKGEVKDALKKDIKKSTINYVEIQEISS